MLTRYTKLVAANSPAAFGVAAGCVALATAIRLGLDPIIGVGRIPPFITMFPAVLVTSLIGGLGPGLLAIALSFFVTWFLFVGQPFAFDPMSLADGIVFVLYVLGALLIVLMATSMRRAVDSLEMAQAKLFAALSASGTGTWTYDVQRDMLEWDASTAELFGISPAQMPRQGKDFFALVHPDDREFAIRRSEEAITGGMAFEHEFRTILPDGTERWIADRARVVRDAEGRPVQMIGAVLDITERKKADEHQTLLMNELNHRVKNTLATVQSMALQTLRSSPNAEAFQGNFMARLMALSATHDVLTRKRWEEAPLAEILVAELQPYGGIDENRISADGDIVRLKPQQALSIGMAFHELATNAAKHGALSVPRGRVRVSWSLLRKEGGERELAVTWQEQDGPPVHEPARRGFGSRLIERSITHELRGAVTMSFAPDGLVCSIRIPLSVSQEDA